MNKFYLVKKIAITTKTLMDSNGKILEKCEPEVTVISEETVPVRDDTNVVHTITGSEAKFGFIAGKDLTILEQFPLGHDLEVHIRGMNKDMRVSAHIHRSLKRRIDGLTKVYKEFDITTGTKLEMSIDTNTVCLKII